MGIRNRQMPMARKLEQPVKATALKPTVFHISEWLINCLRVIFNARYFHHALCLVWRAKAFVLRV